MRGKSYLEAAKNELRKLDAFENAHLAYTKGIAALIGYTNIVDMHVEICARYHAQAGPWAEMLNTEHQINWI